MNSDSKPNVSFARRSSIWCRKRTNTEKRLIWATIIGILIIIILLVIVGVVLDRNSKKVLVCSTPSCIHAASAILKHIDTTKKPCDDFYEFACGTYIKTTTIPEDQTSNSLSHQTAETVEQQLKAIVQEPLDSKAPKQYHLLGQLYKACVNSTAREEDGLKTIKIVLKELGGWPLLEGEYWNEANFEWKRSAFLHRKLGLDSDYFISLYVSADMRNSSRRIITLDQPWFSLPGEFLIKGLTEPIVQVYYNFIVDIAVLFGANRNVALKEMKDMLDFEISLAKITLPKEKRRNSSALYNPMTIEDLRYNYPTINWLEYIFKIVDVPDLEIGDNEVVVIATPQVLTDVLQLLKRTPKRVQANYVMKFTVLSVLTYLNEDVRKRNLELQKVLMGNTEMKPLWRECLSIATDGIHLAAGSMYIRKHFDLQAKQVAEEMVAGIRETFSKILKSTDWMDEETRMNALAKSDAMDVHIGFPVELLDDRKVETYYSNLVFDTDNYLKTIMQLNLFSLDHNYKKLRKPVNKTDWIDHSYPTTVNAFYMSTTNSIEFPAGILQGVFFNKDRPRYLNYGAIGSVIGHEITHGFDDEGSQYDKDGNLNEWWDKNTKEAFVNKAKCIIEQYANYTVPEVGLQINGINTQGENIADNGGIKEAYLAYQSWVNENGLEPKLPGLDYTPNQLFWIAAANIWCSKTRKEYLKLRVTTAYHSIERFRVLGALKNSEYFAKDFNCPVESNMNPTHKCHVW